MGGFAFRDKGHQHPFRTMQYATLMRLPESAPDMKPSLNVDEAILVRSFLRRYVTWCARSGHGDRIEPTALLYLAIGQSLNRQRARPR
jgi:hypothetical protein